jgi:hypothetical protein
MRPKLVSMLDIIGKHLRDASVPYALIGAAALAVYGIPRFTADIDILSEAARMPEIRGLMKRLGFTCFQETTAFARFDSEMGILGRFDFMLMATPDGLAMIERSAMVNDPVWGRHPVVQPTDYLILKLMAIANNPSRISGDEADIMYLLGVIRNDLLADGFEPLDHRRLEGFARRFGQQERLQACLNKAFATAQPPGDHKL